jgi:hypothetical protein
MHAPRGEVQLLLILDLGITWGEWSVSRPGRALPPGMDPVPTTKEAGWASELVWTEARGEILCLCRGSNTCRPVCSQILYSRLQTIVICWSALYKGKVVPIDAMEALGGRGGIAPTHFRPRH